MNDDPRVPTGAAPRESLDDAVRAHRAALVRLCASWVGDAARGEELAHDAIAVAITKFPEFRHESSVFTWLAQIARNLSRNANRKLHDELTSDGVIEAASEEHDALHTLRDDERERVFLAAIADLPQLEQDALYLRYVEGLDRDTITARLGIEGVSGSRATLQKASRHLRERLRAALISLGHGSSFFRST